MVIWDKQDIGTYITEYSFTNTRTHCKRAVVSLTKARNIFTNRTKERNPTKPKLAKPTHLDEGMAQLRRETLKYCTRDTIQTRTTCSCKFLSRFARSIGTISFVFRVSVKVIIDRRIDHLTEHPMGRNPNTLVHTLKAKHPPVPIGHVSKNL
jgi:hypothetical protein